MTSDGVFLRPRARTVLPDTPAPPPGTEWSRMVGAQRRALVMAAVLAGRTVAAVAADHGISPGTHYWRTLSRMMSSRILQVADRSAGPPPGPGVLIAQLNATTCRWPLWDDTEGADSASSLYCGAPRDRDPHYSGPYCPVCRVRARRPGHFFMSGLSPRRR